MEWMRKPGKLTLNMNVNIANIPISLDNGKVVYRSLRWFRGASRYNNGGTKETRLIYEKFDSPLSYQ